MNRTARTGVLIASASLLFVVALFTIGNRTFMFSDTLRVQTQFTQVAGLQEGAPVQFQGINVGRVSDVSLPSAPGEPILVSMSITTKAAHLIRKNTQAQIKSDGLVGEQIIVLINPADIDDLFEDGDLLPGVDPFDLFEITDRAMASVTTFETAAVAFEEIMRDVQRGEGTLGKVIYDSTLYVEIVETTSESRRVLQALATSAEANADILVELATQATQGIESILAKADSGDGSFAKLLNDPALFDALVATTDTLAVIATDLKSVSQSAENAAFWGEMGAFRMAELMEAAKHNWLFRRYFEERGSVEAAPFEVREEALRQSFNQITQRERELLLWQQRLEALEGDLNTRSDSTRQQ
ncbi:MAG: MCE family protein [Bacteroidetes Order II. Incertae sedis bacterium]|jgi:phospholipid/cholesterol/gamma-HCH transport system substrate-binding protein|nr:MCE family protein [Bacteroidetes Order II. bacterium]MDG1754805.1 MlaD family protein [Rhodothermales bacterium]MBT5248580.1 MCE family protein [Bacteroidetes Order II. bacterium]MBT6425282.1 MCE family protein [Bacteroidetes Order II. bacterium]MBT6580363.1 MCE family protein [Bacteroidetes Order II. bacterium]